jgi:uncharacterized lipoprotein YehR (DUF1307 family)
MKLYRTKENNIINLEQLTTIYKNLETGTYNVSYVNGITYEMPDLDVEDINRIMEYSNYLIK